MIKSFEEYKKIRELEAAVQDLSEAVQNNGFPLDVVLEDLEEALSWDAQVLEHALHVENNYLTEVSEEELKRIQSMEDDTQKDLARDAQAERVRSQTRGKAWQNRAERVGGGIKNIGRATGAFRDDKQGWMQKLGRGIKKAWDGGFDTSGAGASTSATSDAGAEKSKYTRGPNAQRGGFNYKSIMNSIPMNRRGDDKVKKAVEALTAAVSGAESKRFNIRPRNNTNAANLGTGTYK